MTTRLLKRALLAIPVVVAALTVAYGYTVTRRERLHHDRVVEGDNAVVRNDLRAAVAAFSHAIALKPESMLGYLKRGDAHRRIGDLEAAAADLERARSLNPTEPRALELLGDVAASRQLHDRAAEYYAACVRLDDQPRVLYKLGLAHHLAGRKSAAAEALGRAISIDSRFAEAHYLLGVSLRGMKQLQAAQASFERAVVVSPNLVSAREQLADVYGLLGRRPERIKQLEELLVADASAVRQVMLAVAYAETGQVRRAIQMLGAATVVYPDYAGTYIALGKLWLDTAIGDGDRVALGKAIEALRRAVSLEASSPALTLLGRARLQVSDLAAAERTLREATETLPVEPEAFLLLAEAAERLGRSSSARRALLDYQALTGTTDAEFLLRLAHAHWRSGDPGAARATLARILETDPGNEQARRLREELR